MTEESAQEDEERCLEYAIQDALDEAVSLGDHLTAFKLSAVMRDLAVGSAPTELVH